MEIEKKHCGLVLLVSLIGCIQLQASDASDASVEVGESSMYGRPMGMPESQFSNCSGYTVAAARSLDSLDEERQSDYKESDPQEPFVCKKGMMSSFSALGSDLMASGIGRPSSDGFDNPGYRASGNALRVASTSELPEVVEEPAAQIVPGLSELAAGVNGLAKEYLQEEEEEALTSLEVQLVAANLTVQELIVKMGKLEDLVAKNASNVQRDKEIECLRRDVCRLEEKNTLHGNQVQVLEKKLSALQRTASLRSISFRESVV